MNEKCNCSSSTTLIFPCSGAADVGELADRAARRMTRSGMGRMYCLAAIGGRVQQYVEDTKAAKDVIIIDGCSNSCAKKTLSLIDVEGHEFDLEKLGLQKGSSPSTSENIEKVISHILVKL